MTTGDTATAGWDAFLAPGETVLWQGKPEAAFDFWGEGPVAIAFGMTLTGGLLAPMSVLIPVFGVKPLIVLPVFLVGLWMLVGKALWRSYRLRRSWYSVTSCRAFVTTALFARPRLREMPLTGETEITEIGGPHGGLLLSAPEGYGLLMERLPARQEILALLWRVQNGALCRP